MPATRSFFPFLLLILTCSQVFSQNLRLRDHGIEIGVLPPGPLNAITDVKGVKVGHTTLVSGDSIRTGVTAIIPHGGNMYRKKVPAAIHIGNGFGKLAGYSQIRELGNIETPVILTNTLSVPVASDALITHALRHPENREVRSVNAVVGETNDGWLNDIRGRHITAEHVLTAIGKARNGPVEEGNTGAGTGTVCFGYKGGIGTSSRIIPKSSGGYTVGVLVQSNFGGVLEIAGVPVAREMNRYPYTETNEADGSCMIVLITDAPLDTRNLERLAKRAMLGLGKTGGIASNGSGDYVIAISIAAENLIVDGESRYYKSRVLQNNATSPLFLAAIEATEEAILNSLFAAETMTGRDGNEAQSLPLTTVLEIMKRYNRLPKQ